MELIVTKRKEQFGVPIACYSCIGLFLLPSVARLGVVWFLGRFPAKIRRVK
jgi:hypothetical protein